MLKMNLMEDKYPENVTVEELENFNKIGQKTYELLEDTGRHILSCNCLLFRTGRNRF